MGTKNKFGARSKITVSEKIININNIREVIDSEVINRKVGLCSGCFDLLHIGHIKHLQAAKRECDILVVGVASNVNVNKGPDRPAFDEQLRMEALASLSCVDYVVLNDNPDSIDLINAVKPDLYIKGSEYENTELDLNNKYLLEKQATEQNGGEIFFTREQVFSSTKLINRHVNKTKVMDEDFDFVEMAAHLENMNELDVLLIGDCIIDEYCYCKVAGTATKHPSLSAIYNRTKKMAGGSLAIARHLSVFVDTVTLITRVADKNDVLQFDFPENIKFIFIEDGEYTNYKKRYISEGYPNSLEKVKRKGYSSRLFEIGYFPETKLSEKNEHGLIELLDSLCSFDKYDCLFVSDFGHGLMTPRVVDKVNSITGLFKSANAQTNSVNFGFNLINRYANFDFVCIDELEARLPYGDKKTDILEIGKKIKDDNNFSNLIITRGHSGQLYLDYDDHYNVPALASSTIDTVGAGDAAFSMASICKVVKMPVKQVLLFSSVAGALATQIVGNEKSIDKKNFLKTLKGLV